MRSSRSPAPSGETPAAPPVAPAESTALASIPPTAIDSQEVVRRLKEATVYIKLKVGNKPFSTGTGFVIESRGDTMLVATNRHVCLLDMSEVPASACERGDEPFARSGHSERPGDANRAVASGPAHRHRFAVGRAEHGSRLLDREGGEASSRADQRVRESRINGRHPLYRGRASRLSGLVNQVAETKGQSVGHDHGWPDRCPQARRAWPARVASGRWIASTG